MPQYQGTTTPLGGSATYTSVWVNTNQWGYIGGSVYADHTGTLYIEQSGDGTNADISDSVAVAASTATKYVEQLLLPYVRLRYVNGSSAQGTFRLFSRFILGNST